MVDDASTHVAPDPDRGTGLDRCGTARLDRRTKRLVGRLRPGDIAVIDHVDLDRVAADALVAARVAAVLNAKPSISGRYPNLGPEVLVSAGIPLARRRRRERLRAIREGDAGPDRGQHAATSATSRSRTGTLQDAETRGRRWPRPGPGCPPSSRRSPPTPWSTSSRSATCCSTASACPTSRPTSHGRHVLIVVRGYDYKRRPGRAAPLHPRVQAGADRRRRRRRRPGRGRLHAPT